MKTKFFAVMLFLVALPALPQTLDAGVGPVVVPPAAPESMTSILMQAGLTLALLVLSTLGAIITKAVNAYAANSKYGSIINQLWLLVQTTVSHAEVEVRPTLSQAAQNGKLTLEDGQKLKALVLASLKRDGADQLTTLVKSFGLTDEAANTLLSGLVERAVSLLKVPGMTTPSSSPSGVIVNPAPTPVL